MEGIITFIFLVGFLTELCLYIEGWVYLYAVFLTEEYKTGYKNKWCLKGKSGAQMLELQF